MKPLGREDFESIEAVEPDIEIVVRCGEHETAVFGLFENKSDLWDVVVGIDDASNREAVMDALSIARGAMEVAHFYSLRTAGDLGSS